MQFSEVTSAVKAAGLVSLGGFHAEPQDGVPAASGGIAIRTVVLMGFAGRDLSASFAGSTEAGDGLPDRLDRWSRRVIGNLADTLHASAMFPFGGPPYLPFQRWAMRAGPVHPSPLGLLIHPEWGLWHSFRGALGFTSIIDLPPIENRASPCVKCVERPCLTTCPVTAFGPDGYAVSRCAEYLETDEGADCVGLGCAARRACPVGAEHRYGPDQATHHMRAFLQAQQQVSAGESAA